VLDINLGHGTTSLELAERLHAAGCPILFLSAYGSHGSDLPAGLNEAPRLSKPYSAPMLIEAVRRLLGRSADGSAGGADAAPGA
jgi:DNA-binding response OmpR family regulator